jgi:HEAT repeat protein
LKIVPIRLLPALALTLAAGLIPLRAARAQDADEAAPPMLAPWSWETTPSHLRIAAALREARRAGPNDGPELQQRIVESGRDAIVAQVDILLRGRVPETSPKDGPQILSETQRALLLSALARMPLKTVRKELDARLAKTPDERNARLGAMQALGVVGQPEDLERIVGLTPRQSEDLEQPLPSSSREALRAAATSLLRRDPRAWPAMAETLRTTDYRAACVLLDALCSARDPRSLGILLETARKNTKLAWKTAGLVQACGSSLNADTDRQYLDWVRGELQTAKPGYARTLLAAVGALDDGEWIPFLAERLEDEDSGIREAALGALRSISGLGFPGDPALWRSWYATESRWHNERRPQLQAQLASPETPKVLSAIREYSEHRTRRGELAEELLPVLAHGKPEVRSLAISVLERLDSPVACGALIGMLNDGDSKVGEAAWHALHAISGIELSRDPEQLRELFGRS